MYLYLLIMVAETIPILKVVSLLQSYHLRAKLVCTSLGTIPQACGTSRVYVQKGFTYQPAPPLFGNVQGVYLYNVRRVKWRLKNGIQNDSRGASQSPFL